MRGSLWRRLIDRRHTTSHFERPRRNATPRPAILLLEDRAHRSLGHYPKNFAELAQGFVERGYRTEVLTSLGWSGDAAAVGFHLHRYGSMGRAITRLAQWHERSGASIDKSPFRIFNVHLFRLRMMAITWISVVEARRLIRRENLEPLGIIALSIHFSLRTLEHLIKDETWIVYALSSAAAVRPTKPLRRGRILLARAARIEPERPGDFPVVELNFSVGRPVGADGASLRSEFKIPPARRILLMVGSGHMWQTPQVAFEALRQRDDVQLVVVGAIAKELEADAAIAWAIPPIVVEGHLPIEELDRYYAAADIVVISVRGGFPHDSAVLVDAASHGVPVIVAGPSTPAATVTTFEAGECFEAGSATSLLAAMDRLDPHRAAMGSRSLAEHYSARNVAATYLAALGCDPEG